MIRSNKGTTKMRETSKQLAGRSPQPWACKCPSIHLAHWSSTPRMLSRSSVSASTIIALIAWRYSLRAASRCSCIVITLQNTQRPASQQHSMEETPVWAQDILDKLDSMESKLDDIESQLQDLDSRLEDVEESRGGRSDPSSLKWLQNKFYIESAMCYHNGQEERLMGMLRSLTPFLMENANAQNCFDRTFLHYILLWIFEKGIKDEETAVWCMRLFMENKWNGGLDGERIMYLGNRARAFLKF